MKPKLRFSEFTDEWQVKKLADVGVKIIDGDRGKKYPNGDDLLSDGYCLFLNAKNVTKSGFIFIDNTFISQRKDSELRKGKLKEFDIVLTTRGTIGNVAYYNCQIPYENVRINSGMVLLRSRNSGVLPGYLYKMTDSDLFNNQVRRISFGSAQPQLTVSGINKIKLSIPSKPEQQKIANFLTSVDDKISAIDKKVELLKEYKKGVTQKIFRQEIRFRNKNGDLYCDWQTIPFDNIFVSLSIKKYQILNSQFSKSGEYPIVDQGQELIAGYSDDSKKLFTNIPVIVFGDHTTFVKYIDFDFIVGADGIKILKQKNNNILKYLFYYLEYNKIEPEGYKRHFGNLRTLIIDIPVIEEQQKIADFLTKLDDKIKLTEQKLNQTKQFKKVLLQRMFV